MTTHDEIDSLKRRIAAAQADRESWRVAGPEERYLEAYVIVKALELQLEETLRQPVR